MTVERIYTEDLNEAKAMLKFAGFAEVATEENEKVVIYENGAGKHAIMVMIGTVSAYIILIDKNVEK